MKKLIMLSLIAVFAICSLVAMDYTVQVTSGSRNNVVDGYCMEWVGDASHPNGYYYRSALGLINILLLDANNHIIGSGLAVVGSNGYYAIPANEYPAGLLDGVHMLKVQHGYSSDFVNIAPYTGNHRVNFTYNDTNY